ncbi:esterase domain protein [Mycobacterium xenopi 4042]|uniref:Esterase domain protein n=1 Tax=Mycobacterium xenopi 4042 TaxID=1299334 RepID=X8DCT7_MYCXE|nr:esterase domain protein [Mycobacterium xenopi 4042]
METTRWARGFGHTRSSHLASQPWQCCRESPAREWPVVFARLGDHRTVDAFGAA